MDDVSIIREALTEGLRRAENRLSNSYGSGIDARDAEWHNIRYGVAVQQNAIAALDRVRDRLNGLNASVASVEHHDDCTCHQLGETCPTCNERYREEEAA